MTKDTSTVALILAGHGSHISPNTAGIVWGYVDTLRRWGVADEITAAFWKEEPSLRNVLDTVTADTVVIVPVFTAQGYFTQTVIPTEMDLHGNITRRDGRTIIYTPTIGEHPYLQTIVQERVTDVLSAEKLPTEDTAIAVIGHGTRRNPTSRDATRLQAKILREKAYASEVVDAYLDDEPYIPDIFTATSAKNIIAVPFFLAEGSHVTIDVPDAMGLNYGEYPADIRGRTVYYTPPVGTDDAICRVILELARDTGLPFARREINGAWEHFPQAGRDHLTTTQLDTGWVFGQVWVTDTRIQHIDQQGESTPMESPQALRSHIRENPFRPLPTSDDLPDGWHVDVNSPEEIHAVLETIYPALIADWSQYQSGTFQTEPLEAIGTRQVGMFQNIHQLDPSIIEQTVERVCGRCIRQPLWLNIYRSNTDKLPCKTACNLWLSTAKEERETA